MIVTNANRRDEKTRVRKDAVRPKVIDVIGSFAGRASQRATLEIPNRKFRCACADGFLSRKEPIYER